MAVNVINVMNPVDEDQDDGDLIMEKPKKYEELAEWKQKQLENKKKEAPSPSMSLGSSGIENKFGKVKVQEDEYQQGEGDEEKAGEENEPCCSKFDMLSKPWGAVEEAEVKESSDDEGGNFNETELDCQVEQWSGVNEEE